MEILYLSLFASLIVVFSEAIETSLTPGEVEICTGAHNKLRRLHKNTPSLEWDDSLAAAAQRYAEKLVEINRKSSTNQLIHEHPTHGMGENLYWQDNRKKGTCADASLAWYNEINDYSYALGDTKNGMPVGHFTQLVWKKTLKFGVGIATMKSRKYSEYGNTETFIVAKYSPKGNFYMTGKKLRDYTANVQPRKAGSVTPTVEELDPTLKQACENGYGDGQCHDFLNDWGYTCHGDEFESYFKENCYKACGYC
ncbi:Golgi-associated plant pathogenesis-related protein 1-like [Clytia hemisphaerica]|uniref:SCP domain-containing protein n=1 Tax=Clytia hemisphaerica TaxID=252671 RepID=A0A7M5XG49_9CNID|eukprot:TCONS_00050892-protein